MSERPIRLDKAFTKGVIRRLYLSGSENRLAVPFNRAWLVLGGLISHITGTESRIICYQGKKMVFMTKIDSGVATEIYPIFNTKADVQGSQYTPMIITYVGGIAEASQKSNILFNGGVNSSCAIQVLEWEL